MPPILAETGDGMRGGGGAEHTWGTATVQQDHSHEPSYSLEVWESMGLLVGETIPAPSIQARGKRMGAGGPGVKFQGRSIHPRATQLLSPPMFTPPQAEMCSHKSPRLKMSHQRHFTSKKS